MAGELIETLYWSRRGRGGQKAQLLDDFDDMRLAQAFRETVSDVASRGASGAFYPEATRTPLINLACREYPPDSVSRTEQLQALLWQPPSWPVAGAPGLAFEFLARELTPWSIEVRGRREWLTDESRRRLSADALLVNVTDRTPIVAEIKVGGDENAELALIQALVAAAQLSSPSQRRRLHRQFRDALGGAEPARLDVYVITAQAPTTGVRPMLRDRAHRRARSLLDGGTLSEWIRRICFLDVLMNEGVPSFSLASPPALAA